MWGTGFGGACVAYSALHLAQGQTAACHTVDVNGLSHWSGIGKELPTASFAVQADTSVVEPETADLVLRILETLSFGVPADQVPVPTPPAAAPGSEVVVDNLDVAFRPKGNWYVRSEMVPQGRADGRGRLLPGRRPASKHRRQSDPTSSPAPTRCSPGGAAIRAIPARPRRASSRCTARRTTPRHRPSGSITRPA